MEGNARPTWMEGKARPILVRKGVSSPQHLGSSLLPYHPKFPQKFAAFHPFFHGVYK
jgi:hypothetical protein